MISSRQELIEAVSAYTSSFPEERQFTKRFLELLNNDRCFHRDHLPGHITGSAFIVDESGTFTLLTHHAKLNRWLQPGGHADGDEDVFRVALKEAVEETGLDDFVILRPGIFDLDIHTIPGRNGFPEHQHYDVRILLQASRENVYSVSEESHDLAWVAFSEVETLTQNHSMIRMVRKAGY